MKKILIYNWIPFDEKELKGGGVTIYTRNLIEFLIHQSDMEVYFLSSGRAYNIERKDVYIEAIDNIFAPNCKSFQIVNSPVLASARLSFPYPQDYLYDVKLKEILESFYKENEFDIIHYQNLEGLSLGVFELNKKMPNTRFIYSVHNYYPICPQVMLWENDEKNCEHKECGEHCLYCMSTDVFKEKVIMNQYINYRRQKGLIIDNQNKMNLDNIVEKYSNKNYLLSLKEEEKEELISNLKLFREKNIESLNKNFDTILAVSERVADILRSQGVNKEKIKVSYIGTKVAENQLHNMKKTEYSGTLNICYLGFMRKMKGFFFIIDALENMPDELAKKISFTFATKITDENIIRRIEKLQKKFAFIRVYEGYTHEQLPHILEDIHLGVVPPLWEDNLPQVAIEMKAYGVAVLSSNLGGAKELTKSEDFVFKAGSIENFIFKIKKIVDNPIILNKYWVDTAKLVTMKEHMEDLLKIYCV